MTVLLNDKVLGKVTQPFLEEGVSSKARSTPHYHVLPWMEDAPVIGKYSSADDEAVLSWIQKRISYHIPDEKTNPELHRLVTKFQLHTCSKYCKHTKKYGNAFVTKCKFGFPHGWKRV